MPNPFQPRYTRTTPAVRPGCWEIQTQLRTADSAPKKPLPDIRLPSEASVIRLMFPPDDHLNTYMPPSQVKAAWPPSVASAVPSGLTTTSTLLDHFQAPTILPQPVVVELGDFDFGRLGADIRCSSPPETDLFSLAMVPLVEPACARAGLGMTHVSMMIENATPQRRRQGATIFLSGFND
jgi:hypothetical protein